MNSQQILSALRAIDAAKDALNDAGNMEAADEIANILNDAFCSCTTDEQVCQRVDANIAECSRDAQAAYYAAMREAFNK